MNYKLYISTLLVLVTILFTVFFIEKYKADKNEKKGIQHITIAGFDAKLTDQNGQVEIPVIVTEVSKDSVTVKIETNLHTWNTTAVFSKILGNTYAVGDKKIVLAVLWSGGYEAGWQYSLVDQSPAYEGY